MPAIRQMPSRDLPREKLLKYGTEKLSDAELLAIILGSGIKNLNVLELSRRIMRKIRRQGIDHMEVQTLLREKGLGKAKALQVIALIELGKRLHAQSETTVLSAKDIWGLCHDIRESKREHLLAFSLDTQGKLLERNIVSIGTLNESLVHPREVFEPAIARRAATVIVAHNHPSGNTDPSEEDISVTRRLFQAGEILGIPLLDHLIVSKSGWMSMKAQNMLF